MNCFWLYRKNGTLEVICSRCHAILGSAGDSIAAREIEAVHKCRALELAEETGSAFRRRSALIRPSTIVFPGHRADPSEYAGGTNIPFAFLSVALVIYAMPTALEFLATHYFNPWLATILLGDLIGCVWLGAVFKMWKTGLLLYLVLAVIKSCLCVVDAVPATTLFWITDLIPAVLVAGRIARRNKQLLQWNWPG